MRELRPKSYRDVTYSNEYEALEVLRQVFIRKIDELFGGNPRMKKYVEERIEGAKEVLKRSGAKDYIVGNEVRSIVPSKKIEGRDVTKPLKHIGLDGSKVVVWGKAGTEDFYVVRVSKYRFKCSCKDAEMLAASADSKLPYALRLVGYRRLPSPEPFFSKYIICKHTLAKLAKAMAGGSDVGIVNIDRDFTDTLVLGLFAIYLRITDLGEIDPNIVLKILPFLRRRMNRRSL